MKKTRHEIDSLKREWVRDPCWNIEETEGFEVHKEELRLFANEHTQQCENDRKLKLQERALNLGIPDNLVLVEYLESLENEIQRLSEKIETFNCN